MLTHLKKIWKRHRKKRWLIGIFILMLMISLLSRMTLAACDPSVQSCPPPETSSLKTPSPPTTPGTQDFSLELAQKLKPIIDFLQYLLWPILLMIGSLLQNDILFGGGMEQKLLDVWVNVRNIVNVLFVIILLGMAIYNVLGLGENYHIKAKLPRFVLALIAVNFSFLGVKVVLDGISVLATGIFALPETVGQNLVLEDSETRKAFCEGHYAGKVGSAEYREHYKAALAVKDPVTLCDDKGDLTDQGKNLFSTFNSRNAAIAMAISLQKINLLNVVYVSKESPNTGKLLINMLFSMVLYIVYAGAYVTLFIVLLVRLVVLWILIVLSPLIVLKFVLPEKLQSSAGGDLSEKFVKNAMVPIPIALVLSIGFILLTALQKVKFPDAGFTSSTLAINLLASGTTTLQDLIVALGAVAFVWAGAFKAMEGTYAQRAVEKMKGWVGEAGKAVAKLPLLAPIFPTGKIDEKTGKEIYASPLAVGKMMQQVPHIPDEMAQKQAREIAPELYGGESGHAQNIGRTHDEKAFRKAVGEAHNEINSPAIQKAIAKKLQSNPTWNGGRLSAEEVGKLEKGVLDRAEAERLLYDPAKLGVPKGGEAAGGKTGFDIAKGKNLLTDEQKTALDDPSLRSKLTPDQQKALTKLDELLKEKADKPEKEAELEGKIKKLMDQDPNAQSAVQAVTDAKKASAGADLKLKGDINNLTSGASPDLNAINARLTEEIKTRSGVANPLDPKTAQEKKKVEEAITSLGNELTNILGPRAQTLRTSAGFQGGSITERVMTSNPKAGGEIKVGGGGGGTAPAPAPGAGGAGTGGAGGASPAAPPVPVVPPTPGAPPVVPPPGAPPGGTP